MLCSGYHQDLFRLPHASENRFTSVLAADIAEGLRNRCH